LVESPAPLTLAAAVLFLNEERLLPRMLDSLGSQRRPPDLLLLVDDGSTDDSPALAAAFAGRHDWVRVLERPRRTAVGDRLAQAAELVAFQWAAEQATANGRTFDVIAKLDADLDLPPDFFDRIMSAFESDLSLGMAGAPLSVARVTGEPAREHSKPGHLRGATKFYRRECFDQISPVPPILGWDTIDETRARMRGWDIRTVEFPDAQPVHLRPTGSHDGALRGFYRRGVAAWGYGAHPAHVAASAALRTRHRPHVLGGVAYLLGWGSALLRRAPRAEPEVRRFLRQEQLHRLRCIVARRRSDGVVIPPGSTTDGPGQLP
jgi:glycosyltransferase involved in cell wall biosynthesis